MCMLRCPFDLYFKIKCDKEYAPICNIYLKDNDFKLELVH